MSINQGSASQFLRSSERISSENCAMELDSFEKKIRTKLTMEVIDAQKEYRRLMCFWKEDWDYQRPHHLIISPRVRYPRVFLRASTKTQSQSHLQFMQYLRRFLVRLAIDQQHETNFKVLQESYIEDFEKYYYCSIDHTRPFTTTYYGNVGCTFGKEDSDDDDWRQLHYYNPLRFNQKVDAVVLESLKLLSWASETMRNNLLESVQKSQGFQIGDEDYQETAKSFHFIQQIINRAITQEQGIQLKELILYVKNILNSITYHSPVVMPVQPNIAQLTYILHPILISIHAYYQCQLQLKQSLKCKHTENTSNKLKQIRDNLKAEQQIYNKIAFINLDGYESQFNYELARNYPKHLLYISFPKFGYLHHPQSYHLRFIKKIMYHLMRAKTQPFPTNYLQEELLSQQNQYAFKYDPEKYFNTSQKLYEDKDMTKRFQFGSNIYTFPIDMKTLWDEFKTQIPIQEQNSTTIVDYQTYLIRFLFRDIILPDIQKFKPKHIIVSWSSRLRMQNSHFVELIKELNTICDHRIILVPNFTTGQCDQELVAVYGLTKCSIPIYEQSAQCSDDTPPHTELLDKILRFLKVSSGTHSMAPNREPQSIEAIVKNGKIYPSCLSLMELLGREYEHLENRLRKKSFEVATVMLENGLRHQCHNIISSVPKYYLTMLSILKRILWKDEGLQTMWEDATKMKAFPKFIDEDIKPYLVYYGELVESIYNSFQLDKSFSRRELKKLIEDHMQCQVVRLAGQKFQREVNVYIRCKPENQEYASITDQKKDNRQGLYTLSFFLRKNGENKSIQIKKQTLILYDVNQIGNESCHILVMNYINEEDSHVGYYIGKINLSNSDQRVLLNEIQWKMIQGIQHKYVPFQLHPPYQPFVYWNYAQTQHKILLYWPTAYDHLKAQLYKLMGREYEGFVANRVFIANKRDYTLLSEIEIIADGLYNPRRQCSAYTVANRILIFGGFHQKEQKYDKVQNEIVLFEIPAESKEVMRIFLRVQNNRLYGLQAFNERMRQRTKPNSYIRPRAQYQFFREQQLNNASIREQGIIALVMLGGYGQYFLTPYSLNSNYYYRIRVTLEGEILSIEHKPIYGSIITTNTKNMIKNNVINEECNIYTRMSQPMIKSLIRVHHYIFHRICYSLQNNEFNSKIKLFFAAELFYAFNKHFLPFAHTISVYHCKRETERWSIQLLEGNQNNCILTLQDQNVVYSLQLQYGPQKLAVPLSNESILSIACRKPLIAAIIKHPHYTENKHIMAYRNLNDIEPSVRKRSKNFSLLFEQSTFLQFSNLDKHVMCITKANEVAIVHGDTLPGFKVSDYIVRIRNNNAQLEKTVEIQSFDINIRHQDINQIVSFIAKRENKAQLQNYNFWSIGNDAQAYYIMTKNTLCLANPKSQWKREYYEHIIFHMHGTPVKNQHFRFVQTRLIKQVVIFRAEIQIQFDVKQCWFVLLDQCKPGMERNIKQLRKLELQEQLNQKMKQMWNEGPPTKGIVKSFEDYYACGYEQIQINAI